MGPHGRLSPRETASTAWFVAGLVLSTATRLRPTGLPIGPGEVLLASWALASAPAVLRGMRAPWPPAAVAFAGLWVVAMPLLLGGWVVAFLLGVQSAKAWHDAAAFAFLVTVLGSFLVLPSLERRVRLAARMLVPAVVVPLAAMLAWQGWTSPEPWAEALFGTRFHGWSLNPNANAVLLLPIPFLALWVASTAPSVAERVAASLLLPAALVLGLACQSDAMFIAWAAAVVAALAAVALAHLPHLPLALREKLCGAMVLVLVLGAAASVLAVEAATELPERIDQQGQLGVRVTLWTNGLHALARSPLVGLGPGAHSGFAGPFEAVEAHNSFIDFAASTGLVGLALLLGWFVWIGRRVLATGSPLFLAAFVAFPVYLQFHYHLRHPILWFGLLAIGVLAAAPAAAPAPTEATEAAVPVGVP